MIARTEIRRDGVRLKRTEVWGRPGRIATRPYTATHGGVQRGEAPLPGVRGCPSIPFLFFPQEWETKGVDVISHEATLGQ